MLGSKNMCGSSIDTRVKYGARVATVCDIELDGQKVPSGSMGKILRPTGHPGGAIVEFPAFDAGLPVRLLEFTGRK